MYDRYHVPYCIFEESDLHSVKHFSPKTSTDAGRMISTKPVLRNADSSFRDNFGPDLNVTEESDLFKHNWRKFELVFAARRNGAIRQRESPAISTQLTGFLRLDG
jgi:hypothetical protein